MQKGIKKWVIAPGTLFSRVTGESVMVSADRLMELYGVTPEECIIAPTRQVDQMAMMERGDTTGLIWLRPDPKGRYALPGVPQVG